MSIRSALKGPADKEQRFNNVTKCAYKLGVSESYIRAFIKAGELPATKTREGWMVREADFKAFQAAWKPGRPGRPAKDCGYPPDPVCMTNLSSKGGESDAPTPFAMFSR
ncbi:MAG: helix-turn-helix domain-containing protein [Deltaproteobacteria bacterium]|nr:helix-turn-helix domain-containing protein [Deltaproteobacteria bacterium]